jgi:hypothetical protein
VRGRARARLGRALGRRSCPRRSAIGWFAFVPLLFALDACAQPKSGTRRVRRVRPAVGACSRSATRSASSSAVGTHWIALLSDVAITVPW